MKTMGKLTLCVLLVLAVFAACDMPPLGGFPDRTRTYTITFDSNGGNIETSPVVKTVTSPETTVGTLPASPTRSGYSFNGWNTQAGGGGTVFTASTTVNANITVYAQWVIITPNSFKVTFDKNGGDTDANPVQKIVTAPAITIDRLPEPPTRDGYDFSGWNTKADGSGDSYVASTGVNRHITVYAQWTAVIYTVTFYLNYGEGDTIHATQDVASGNTVTLPSIPERSVPYHFSHWNTQPEGGESSVFNETITVNRDIKVYARWTTVTYTVTFNKNYGDAEENPQPMTIPSGSTVGTVGALPSLERGGYQFDGWYTQPGGGNEFTANTPVNEKITVYAKWTPIYTITYDGNGNTGGSAPIDTGSPYRSGATVTVLDNTGGLVRTGYRFDGWSTQSNGGIIYPVNEPFSITTNVILYAKWIPTYTVTYIGNGSTGGSVPTDSSSPYINGATVTVLGNTGSLVKTGHVFSGWNTEINGSGTNYAAGATFNIGTVNVTLYAKWIPEGTAALTITFDQIADAAPSITGPTLHKEADKGSTTATLTLSNPEQYSQIKWRVDSGAVTGTGASFTLYAANHTISKHFVTVSVIKNGVPYNTTVQFDVEL